MEKISEGGEYVPNLTERDKWEGKRRDVQVGDFVLVIDDNTPY
jgi:Family of unknown function (DUF5641)